MSRCVLVPFSVSMIKNRERSVRLDFSRLANSIAG
jgi:hypothetical protein